MEYSNLFFKSWILDLHEFDFIDPDQISTNFENDWFTGTVDESLWSRYAWKHKVNNYLLSLRRTLAKVFDLFSKPDPIIKKCE